MITHVYLKNKIGLNGHDSPFDRIIAIIWMAIFGINECYIYHKQTLYLQVILCKNNEMFFQRITCKYIWFGRKPDDINFFQQCPDFGENQRMSTFLQQTCLIIRWSPQALKMMCYFYDSPFLNLMASPRQRTSQDLIICPAALAAR